MSPFRLTEGIDTYNPALSSDTLAFLRLNSVEPRLGRLIVSKGYTPGQTLNGESIIDFGYSQLSNRQFSNFYAFTETSVFWFDFQLGAFNLTPIYTGFQSSLDQYVILPWYGCLYVTKLGGPYVKIERKVVTVVADAPFARYGVVANSHAFLGAVGDSVSRNLSRTRWSDLENLEDFEISPSTSEADFFDLESDARQITGVSYQRGLPIVYAENAIWVGSPIGFPGGFRMDPLFSGIGNIFHGGVVRNKEIDYFIGQDNFYELNGLQLSPIGDKIFERFISDIQITSDTRVRGFVDSRKSQVFWIYTKSNGAIWSVVYNYVEKKWTERDPQGITTFFDSPRVALRGYQAIDDISIPTDNSSQLIDDPNAGYPVILKQLAGSTVVGEADNRVLKLNGAAFACLVETFDFFFTDFAEKNEVTRINIEYVGVGAPNLTLRVGSRNNQSSPVVWSDAKAVENIDGTLAFFIRREGVGKYLRFEFSWTNTATNYITELTLLGLEEVEISKHDDSTK